MRWRARSAFSKIKTSLWNEVVKFVWPHTGGMISRGDKIAALGRNSRRLKFVTWATYFLIFSTSWSELGSSISIVSGYGLDDQAIEVGSPAEAKGFFPVASVSRPCLRPTQPPVQWVPGVLCLGIKRGRGVTLTTHPHPVPRSRMCRSYISSPHKCLRGV
jgi:hypothetical protein